MRRHTHWPMHHPQSQSSHSSSIAFCVGLTKQLLLCSTSSLRKCCCVERIERLNDIQGIACASNLWKRQSLSIQSPLSNSRWIMTNISCLRLIWKNFLTRTLSTHMSVISTDSFERMASGAYPMKRMRNQLRKVWSSPWQYSRVGEFWWDVTKRSDSTQIDWSTSKQLDTKTATIKFSVSSNSRRQKKVVTISS